MKNKLIYVGSFFLAVLLIFNAPVLKGQGDSGSYHVTYLSELPEIDGILDSELTHLKTETFPTEYKSSKDNPDVKPTFRLAYGAGFFYVYMEAEADSLIYRDRGYQNGDGFHMVLAKPQPDNEPSGEFYVLACSAVDKKSMEWSRNFFWYYNVTDIFIRTSKDTRLEFAEKDGKISFELILPWKDVYPYHPWLSDGIGFNLAFVKAIGEQHSNIYKIMNVELGAENSKRDYVVLDFEDPEHGGEAQTYFIPDRNNIDETDVLTGTAVTVASGACSEELAVKITTGDGYLLDYSKHKYECKKGLTKRSIQITEKSIPAGGYKLEWRSVKNNSEGDMQITSLSEFSKEKYYQELEAVKDRLTESAYLSLKHRIYETGMELSEVKTYETCGKQRMAISAIADMIEKAGQGHDVIAAKRGFVRKAYLSKLDSTLQPYMVYVPEDYDPGTTYPLLIYLHGSASDETNFTGLEHMIPDGFIGLAPYGRGTSNCYSWDNAQTDISEAIDAVCQSYSIDENNLLLTGFSMGGYGVYRTFHETPGRFKALGVFSGHPNIANKWSGTQQHPDFTKDEYLTGFKDVPVFIFHGEQDRNCSYEITSGIIERLKHHGAKVKFVSEADKGHESPGPSTIETYHNWVKDTFGG